MNFFSIFGFSGDPGSSPSILATFFLSTSIGRIAKKIIKDKNTISQTLKLANEYGEKAKYIMKDFESNPIRNALIDLVDFSLIRNH